ncbi:MAG: RNA polymerase subunit sigma-24 [Crocinitomicaceae bacterium]|nr:RNA polymerase subunit sigma-24 [Crocinitomicaceae bacterium]|tara:strand:+ start:3430 stop:3987 length:558 start_codon:yes stop_codon:yes gene_type:complete
MEDSILIGKILDGDLRSFKILVEQNERLVFHVVGKLIGEPREEIEDLCQEVFLLVFKQLPKFKEQSKLSTWIAKIAFNTTINHLKKKKIKLTHSELENIDFQTPESLIILNDQKEFLRTQINQLPKQYGLVITLFHLNEMSYPEIVEITNWPIGTVKNYLYRARKLLKEKLVKHSNLNLRIHEEN